MRQGSGATTILLALKTPMRPTGEIPSWALLYRIWTALPVNESSELPSFTIEPFDTTVGVGRINLTKRRKRPILIRLWQYEASNQGSQAASKYLPQPVIYLTEI